MNEQLKRIIRLIQKTGDKVVVYNDSEPDMVFVAMGMDAYEKISTSPAERENLSEEELLERINRDIAFWKAEQDIEPEEKAREDLAKNETYETHEPVKSKRWQIPSEIKEAADEVIEEDRQYLEEITF
jgi:cysteinyl-tRNA synthetase